MSLPLVTRSFTVDEYHRMVEAGILREDDRVELLDGQIVEMSPIGPRHAGCVSALNHLLIRRLGDTVILGIQNPLVLRPRSAPEPDVAVLRRKAGFYRDAHPGPDDVLLVIEVADSSAETDRDVKIPLYAAAGIREVWLVDLEHERVHVYRSPSGNGYADVRTLARGDTVVPLLVASGPVEVREILG
jgi:Uma2 family endonuclease